MFFNIEDMQLPSTPLLGPPTLLLPWTESLKAEPFFGLNQTPGLFAHLNHGAVLVRGVLQNTHSQAGRSHTWFTHTITQLLCRTTRALHRPKTHIHLLTHTKSSYICFSLLVFLVCNSIINWFQSDYICSKTKQRPKSFLPTTTTATNKPTAAHSALPHLKPHRSPFSTCTLCEATPVRVHTCFREFHLIWAGSNKYAGAESTSAHTSLYSTVQW